MRTRVGYTGGTKRNPTYRDLGDHAETIEIDFDPTKTSYAALLDVFWRSHNPCSGRSSRQYMSAVFYHDAEQKRLAEASAARVAKARGSAVQTMLEKASTFYLAEDYHQKYRLRNAREIAGEYLRIYPELSGFVDSTTVTRVNGYLGGHGKLSDFRRDLSDLGLSADAQQKLVAAVERRLSR